MKRTSIKKRPLSDTVIANLEPELKEYSEKDSKGLYLFVKPTGAKSWKMRYKDAKGKWRWHGLGAYPAVTGAMARKLVQEKFADLALGLDELTAIPAPPTAQTFKSVALEWYNEPSIQKLDDGTKSKYLSLLEKHIFPTMGKKAIGDISRQVWLTFFRKLQETPNPQIGKPIIETANRALQVCSRIYRFALTQELAGVEFNPLEHLHERLEKHEPKQLAHVSEQDLHKLLLDIKTIPSEITRLGVQLLSHLFLRPNEVLDGEWVEIDFNKGIWEIPAHRMKKRRPHVVPLSKQALALLQQLHSLTGFDTHLFPSRAKDRKNAHQRFRMALNRLGYHDTQTLHGFRHVASTKLNNYTDENGKKFDGRVIEFALAHKVQGVAGVYNKAEYLHDRKIINQWYSDWLDGLVKANDN